jgi:hypothetical protein
MAQPNDCLVLNIKEYDVDDERLDTSLFILYDTFNKNYVIRGKRRDSRIGGSKDYSFTSNSVVDLVNFINYSMCSQNRYSYALYNYDNLPCDSNEITFYFLEEWVSSEYEIAAYDNCNQYNFKYLVKLLRMLKNVSNPYY